MWWTGRTVGGARQIEGRSLLTVPSTQLIAVWADRGKLHRHKALSNLAMEIHTHEDPFYNTQRRSLATAVSLAAPDSQVFLSSPQSANRHTLLFHT